MYSTKCQNKIINQEGTIANYYHLQYMHVIDTEDTIFIVLHGNVGQWNDREIHVITHHVSCNNAYDILTSQQTLKRKKCVDTSSSAQTVENREQRNKESDVLCREMMSAFPFGWFDSSDDDTAV